MPRYCGDYMDSQSGMLTGLDIIYEGAFLTGYLYDSRYFLYDFSDPDNPVEIYSIAPYCFSCKALFVVEFPAGSGRYNVIIVRSGENGEYGGLFYKTLLYSNLVFDQESITYIPPQGTWYHDEWPPEDHPYFKIETRYVFLKEILPDNQFRYLVIDMQEEMIVNFTIDTIGRSKEEIKQLLLHLEE
jgi:hypothetical protein